MKWDCGQATGSKDFWRDRGRLRKRLVDEKELFNENKIRSIKVMIFLISGLMERICKETNKHSKEEAEVFEDDFVEEDFCMKQK